MKYTATLLYLQIGFAKAIDILITSEVWIQTVSLHFTDRGIGVYATRKKSEPGQMRLAYDCLIWEAG